MVDRRRIISVLLVAGLATMTARADMVPVYGGSAGVPETLVVGGQTGLPRGDSLDWILDLAGDIPVGSLSAAYLSGCGGEAGPSFGAQPVQLATDGRSSLSLFLCGLMSLGVFRSAVWLKKMSFGGLIPDWYSTGGPFQIGHSLAIGPDLHFVSAHCFVQPDCTAEDCLPLYYQGIIPSLWRESQFVPTILASRGPPNSPK